MLAVLRFYSCCRSVLHSSHYSVRSCLFCYLPYFDHYPVLNSICYFTHDLVRYSVLDYVSYSVLDYFSVLFSGFFLISTFYSGMYSACYFHAILFPILFLILFAILFVVLFPILLLVLLAISVEILLLNISPIVCQRYPQKFHCVPFKPFLLCYATAKKSRALAKLRLILVEASTSCRLCEAYYCRFLQALSRFLLLKILLNM